MPETASPSHGSAQRWILPISFLFPLGVLIVLLVLLGQDRNWDLQNYHLYNPFAWLHGRMALDIAPAQMQTWLNPLLDVPLYLLASAHQPGWVIGLWLTLPTMLALYMLLRMMVLLEIHPATRTRLCALGLLAMTGVASFAITATSFNDGFVAAGMLGSLYLLLREDPDADRASVWCIAGVLAGAIAGLKLTAGVYCIGLAGAALAMPSWQRMPRRIGALLLGGILGLALTYGYWGMLLFHLHGNPVFPYFNQWFHSPDALFVDYGDERYKPKALVDALLIPVRLLQPTKLYSERELRDPRLLLGMIACIWMLWRARRGDAERDRKRFARLRAVAGFFFVSLLVWECQYGIYRYALPLEMLACLLLMLALEGLPTPRRGAGSVIACLIVIGATQPTTWGRAHADGSFLDVGMPPLPANSMVVLSGESPLGFAVTALPDDVATISIDNNFMHPRQCTTMTASAERRIETHAGPLWLLRGNAITDDEGQRSAREAYGLVVAGACKPVATSFGSLRLCPLRRDPKPVLCAMAASAPGR